MSKKVLPLHRIDYNKQFDIIILLLFICFV